MYKHILVPVDLNDAESWRKALPQAVTLAQTYGAVLNVLNVVPDFGMAVVGSFFPEGFEEQAQGEAEAALEKLVAEAIPEGVETVATVMRGRVYQAIMATADRIGADLIVMAAHRPELKDYLLGPNAARVVRHADQSVLIVR